MFTAPAIDPRTIDKLPLTVGVTDEISREVLTKARKQLGYTGLGFADHDVLANILNDLGIQILSRQQVEDYKRSKEKSSMISGTKIFIFGIFAHILGAILCTVGIIKCQQTPVGLGISIGVTVMVGISLFIWLVSEGYNQRDSGFQNRQYWVTESIGEYKGYVPVFALNYILNIKERVEKENLTCRFSIDQLILAKEQVRRPDPDPFLKVSLGRWDEEAHYIAVWDEREFEARM